LRVIVAKTNRERIMGTWNENKKSMLDRATGLLLTYWGGLLIVIIWCVASTMEYNDELKTDRVYTEHSVDYGRDSVKIGKQVREAK